MILGINKDIDPYPEVGYDQEKRPQFHFSAKKNWINDPNGLVYYEGEYHLFFQHNPEDWKWGNMTWGHAVCKDLLHWKQIQHAMLPDERGTIFSGSAVMDHANTAGFRSGWEYRGLRTSRYTYARSLVELRRDYVGWGEDAEYARKPEIFLFDNVKDPYQMDNVAGRAEIADVQAGLEQKLVARLKETKDDFRLAEDYIEHFAPNGELVKPIV